MGAPEGCSFEATAIALGVVSRNAVNKAKYFNGGRLNGTHRNEKHGAIEKYDFSGENITSTQFVECSESRPCCSYKVRSERVFVNCSERKIFVEIKRAAEPLFSVSETSTIALCAGFDFLNQLVGKLTGEAVNRQLWVCTDTGREY
jgi:hypothetical protein